MVTTTISYQPQDKAHKQPILPTQPLDALSFQKYQHTIAALGKQYQVTLLPGKPGMLKFFEYKVVDGQHKHFSLQNMGEHWQCSCKEFCESQTNHCEHIGLIEHCVNNLWAFHNFAPLGRELLARRKDPTYRTSVVKWQVYDGETDSLKLLGVGAKPGLRAAPVIEGVAVPRFRDRFDLDEMVKDSLLISQTPISTGILKSSLNLYDYQEKIFASMLKAKKAVCSMTMGSGKTLTSIACFGWIRQNLKPTAKALVICPKSLKIQWQKEFKRALDLPASLINDPAGLEKHKNSEIKIVTYQFFSKHFEKFTNENYDLVVMDEIQFIRNDESKAWKAAKTLKTEFFFGLSGTVIENRLDDLYSIMDVIAPGTLGPKWKFSNQFQNLLNVNRKVLIFGGIKNIEQLHAKIKDRVFGYDKLVLPAITHTHRNVAMTQTQQDSHERYYAAAQKLLAKSMNSGLSFSEKMMLQSFLLKARQSCNALELITKQPDPSPSPKTTQIVNDIKALVQSNRKVVLFSQWTEYLDILKREFLLHGIGCVFFTGRETERQRHKAVEAFTNDPSVSVFMGSDAGGVGLDGLQFASSVIIHTELPWNPARLDQRTGRVHRLGQVNPVDVFYYETTGTIEEKMQEVLQGKRDIRSIALDIEEG